MYIIAGLGERENNTVYNSAVLIDRQGRVAGKYRKVYLARGEFEEGCTPGNSFPVFDTDFGRIGIMICWDLTHVEPAQSLAQQGAEIIFMPIWGGISALAPARAIENQVYLVSSAYNENMPSAIFDPWGAVSAEAGRRPGIAWVDIDLSVETGDVWKDTAWNRILQERREDIPLIDPGY